MGGEVFRIKYRLVLRVASPLLAVLLVSAPAAAQQYPSKPVTLVNGTQGTGTEAAARAWMNCAAGEKLAGQPFVLQNKPGANGVVAAQFMRQQPNDGYTLMISGTSNMTIVPFTFKQLPYDPEKEFEGGAMFGVTYLVLVANAQSGIKTVKDMADAARANPKGLDIAVPSLAGSGRMLAAATVENLKLNAQLVATQGEAGAVTALLGNHMPLSVLILGTVQPHVDAGKMIPLMVFAEQRLPSMPQAPTVIEALGDRTMARSAWIGITAKAGGPPEVVKGIETWTRACLQSPEFTSVLQLAGFTPRFVPASEYAQKVRSDIVFWRSWIDKLGISN